LLGAFAAHWRTGQLSTGRLALTLGGVVCVHLGANLANDYFDEVTGCDRLNPQPTPFSGGSRVIQDGLIPASGILAASISFFALGMAQGLWLNRLVGGNAVLWLGIAGLLCGMLYTAVPFKLSYRGVGEILIFVAFGPLVVAGSFLCQAGRLEIFPLLVSVPAGLMVMSILLVNEVLDFDWDRTAGKRTLIVILGEKRGYLLYLATYLAAHVWIVVGVIMRIYPVTALVALAPMGILLHQLTPRRALAGRAATIDASRFTILTHNIGTSLLAVSYLAPW
jgi:1,4-dihydroxy-2-naphthoate octaprenyltransferase